MAKRLTIARPARPRRSESARPPAFSSSRPRSVARLLALIVDQPRVFLEDRVLAAARRVLQLEDRVGVEQVVLAVAPPLVLAARFEIARRRRPRSGTRVRCRCRTSSAIDVDADAADARRGPGEVLVDERLIEADRLEDLRAAVALQRRDAHLGHHLQDALVERLDVVLAPPASCVTPTSMPLPDHVVERLERQIRVDDAGAVAEQQRAVVHFARVARFDDQRAARPRALADEMMVHAGRREQARDRRAIAVGAAVRQDQDRVARFDRVAGALLQLLQRALEARRRPARGSNSIGSVDRAERRARRRAAASRAGRCR